MATQAPPKPGSAPQPEADDPLILPPPPEEEFWDRYNKRLEFPLSAVAAVLAHVLVGAIIIFVLGRMAREDDRSGVPVVLMDGGEDDSGMGSAGSGGEQDPLAIGQSDFKESLKILPDVNALPQVTEDLKKVVDLDDPNSNVGVSPQNAAAYTAVDDTLKKKLLGIGSQKGDGQNQGKGFEGTKGTGPGGSGADSTRARSLRWVMRFRTKSGADYVEQLAAMKAIILVPLPPDNKQCLIVKDLRNPSINRMATDDDLKELARQVKFSDTRPDSVRNVCEVLGIKSEGVKSFWAFFPKGLEDELARKETGFRGRQADAIDETVFSVRIRGDAFEIVVVEQTPKK